MDKKLPRIEIEDVNKALKRFQELGPERFCAFVMAIMSKDNPLVLTQIDESLRQLEETQDPIWIQEIHLRAILILFETLRQAMQNMPISKCDNDSLPTVSEKTVLSIYEQHLRRDLPDPKILEKKIRKLKSENPALAMLVKTSLTHLDMLMNMFNFDEEQKSVAFAFTGIHMMLVYDALKSQADCNRMDKLLGNFNEPGEPDKTN